MPPLSRYVETEGRYSPVPLQTGGFTFKTACSKEVTSEKATIAQQELDFELRHGVLQDALLQKLRVTYGKQNVWTGQPGGVGTVINNVVQQERDLWFCEIKTALTARACLREAVGQMLKTCSGLAPRNLRA